MHSENRLMHNWLARKLVNDQVREHIGLFHGLVIDLGCGQRPYERDILGQASRYVGLDWNNTLHGLHADIAADLGSALPIRSGVADCVTAFEVLEHLAEPSLMLSEAARILVPGGCLVLSVPLQWRVHEAPWDYQRYTRHGLEYQLAKAGFHRIEITATSGFWTMWTLKLNYQLVKLVRGPRPMRLLARALLAPFWWLDQTLALVINRWRTDEDETIGYFAIAYKP